MERVVLSFSVAIGACSFSPQEAAMRQTGSPHIGSGTSGEQGAPKAPAAQGPMVEPVSAAEVSAPRGDVDRPDDALGRRTLSTAFVMIGPDRLLTVGLRDGRSIVLRDVVMRPKDYCGVRIMSGGSGAGFCGGYADVVTARPGGPVATDRPVEPGSDAKGVMAGPGEVR